MERVILWGLMASGKSTVGAELARRLGWRHVDLDREIERREGRTIAAIFSCDGEPFFRRLETEISAELIASPRMVLSCGGGWITNPEILETIPPGSLTVWLQVSPEILLSRVRSDAAGAVRPLLSASDPVAVARRLLAEREPLYRAADLTISTDTAALPEIVRAIEVRVRQSAPASAVHTSPENHAEQGRT